jgi:hypothetical protein
VNKLSLIVSVVVVLDIVVAAILTGWKLCGVLDWPWLAVLAVWSPTLLFFAFILLAALFMAAANASQSLF